jgi:hypothetical protein
LFSDDAQTLTIAVGGTQQILLADTMPSADVTLGTNAVTIVTPGVYEVNYYLAVGTVLTAVSLSAGVRIATTFIPSTFQTRLLSLTSGIVFQGSVLVTLAAGDSLNLAATALVTIGVSLSDGVNASLTVKKVSI